MKSKHSTRKDLLFLSISSFIVVAAWIGFNLYDSWVTTTITPEMQITISPINPVFDTSTITSLKSRKQVTPISILSNQLVTPTPEVASETEPAPAPSLSPTPTPADQTQIQTGDIPVTVQGQ